MHIPVPEQSDAHEGYADTPGTPLWYWDTGGKGTPIILCHPASQSCQIWQYQQPVFSAAGYRVIAYSRRGHHRTAKGPHDDCGTTVGDLISLMNVLDIQKAHILGAAAGGITAMACAVAHPDRVHTLILAGTIVSPNEDEWRTLYGRLGLAAAKSAVSTEFLELGPSYRASNPEGTALFADLARKAKPHGPMTQPSGVNMTWSAMERTSVPTLLITGEADLYAPPPLQNLIASHLPHTELATFRTVGHAAYWEDPIQFNKIILGFLARQKNMSHPLGST